MLQNTNHKLWMLWICCLLAISVQAQNAIRSPYSSYGIGLLNHSVSGTLDAMGGVAYAMQDPFYINFLNPASYAAFDSLSFVADVAASIYSSKLSQGPLVQKNDYVKPNYIAIGVPVTRHWRTSVGVLPYSSVGYNISTDVNGENVGMTNYAYAGEGGINKLYWGNAFKLCKGLSIGFNVSYMFGSILSHSNVEIEGENFYNAYILDAYHVDGIYFDGGIQYLFNIGENHRVGLGAVYSNTAYIWAKEKVLVNTYSGIYVNTTLYDTVTFSDDIHGTLNIPQSIGAGFSYSYKNKMTVAADVTWQNWEKFQFLKATSPMINSMTGNVGIQYIPNPLSNKFFHKMAFRAGARYCTGNLLVNDKPIRDFSVCIGAGVPLTTFNTHSSINILFEYGQMGTLSNDLVKQDYFRFSFCFTLQERWYQRFKID